MAGQAHQLSYAVRGRVLLRHLGTLMLALGALGAVPGIVALVMGDLDAAWRYGVCVVVLAAGGAGLCRFRSAESLQSNEALVIVAGAFLISPLVMSFPLTSSGLGWTDALFEAISGVTTTGLSVGAAAQYESPAFVFGRAWMQWYGGLGIVILSLALIIQGGSARRRFAESEGIEDEGLLTSVRRYARTALLVYVAMTAVGIGLLLITGIGLLDAAAYAFAAISTGGFSPRPESLTPLGLPGAWIVTLGSLAGAVSFALYVSVARRGGLRHFWRLRQTGGVLVMGLTTVAVLTLSFRLLGGMSWADTAHHAPLMALSAQTTSGFSSLDVASLDPASKLLMIVSMAIGGEAGSTAGGLKILRLLIVLRMIQALAVRSALPRHAVHVSKLGGRRLEDAEISEALTIVLMFIGVIVLSWIPFVAMGYDPLDALFEVTSATGTVGLSTGICDGDLPTMLKAVLAADMLLGRLEILAWLVVLRPGTWIGKRGRES